jgi:hypothetical protein
LLQLGNSILESREIRTQALDACAHGFELATELALAIRRSVQPFGRCANSLLQFGLCSAKPVDLRAQRVDLFARCGLKLLELNELPLQDLQPVAHRAQAGFEIVEQL